MQKRSQSVKNIPERKSARSVVKSMKEEEQFIELCKIMDILLGKNGCPWDKAQTHMTLRPHLLEESYEVVDAIDNNDMDALREELGDLLLHVIIHSRIAEKEKHFSLADVIGNLTEKLVRRHTHIFAGDAALSPADGEATWEANKIKEKEISTPLENMQAVPKALPALARAQKVIKRSAKDFCEEEIIKELRLMLNKENLENCGRFLFLITALLTKMQINAEFSLTNTTQEFINSFK